MMRYLSAVALMAVSTAAQAAEPPLSAPEAAQPDTSRFIWESQVQVIQLRIRHVQPPRSLPGDCVVTGVVESVWQGDAYQPGNDVTLNVPCNSTPRRGRGDRYDGRSDGLDPRVVMQSTSACVHIRRSGELFWGGSGRRMGPCGSTTGYTPLDPPALRLDPSNRL